MQERHQVHIDHAGWMWKSPPQSHDADKKDTFRRRVTKAVNSFRQRFIPAHHFKKRYFVLDGNTLYYFKDESLYSLSGSIDLGTVLRVVPYTETDLLWSEAPPFALQIVTDARVFIVIPFSLEEQNEWLRRLGAIIRAGQRQGLLAKSLRGKAWEQDMTTKKNYQIARKSTISGGSGTRRSTVTGTGSALDNTVSEVVDGGTEELPPSHEGNRHTIDGFPSLQGMEESDSDTAGAGGRTRNHSLVVSLADNDVVEENEDSWEILSGNVDITKTTMCSKKRLGHIPIFSALHQSNSTNVATQTSSDISVQRMKSLTELLYRHKMVYDSTRLFRELGNMRSHQQALWTVLVKQVDMLLYEQENAQTQPDEFESGYNVCIERSESIQKLIRRGSLEVVPCGALIKPASSIDRIANTCSQLPLDTINQENVNILLHGRVRVSVAFLQEDASSRNDASSVPKRRLTTYGSSDLPVYVAEPDPTETSNASIIIRANDTLHRVGGVNGSSTHPFNRPADSGKHDSALGNCYWLEVTANAGPIVLSHQSILNSVKSGTNDHASRGGVVHVVEIAAVEPCFVLSLGSSLVQEEISPISLHRLCRPFMPEQVVSSIPSFFAAYALLDSWGLPLYDTHGELAALLSYAGKFVRLGPGETLFQAGDWGDCCYVILEGSVAVSALNPGTGEHQLLGVKSKGSCIGEISLTCPSVRYYNTVALSTVFLLRFFHGTTRTLFSQTPNLWRKLSDCMSWREPSHIVRLPVLSHLCSGQGEATRLAPLTEFFRPIVLTRGNWRRHYCPPARTLQYFEFNQNENLIVNVGDKVGYTTNGSVEHVDCGEWIGGRTFLKKLSQENQRSRLELVATAVTGVLLVLDAAVVKRWLRIVPGGYRRLQTWERDPYLPYEGGPT